MESNEKRSQRLQQDRTCKAQRRLFQTDYETQVRQHRNKISQAQKRECSTIDKAVAKFLSKIEIGADFVCTSCHRLLYRNSVVTCNRAKYTKCTEELLNSVLGSNYISNDGNVWVCKTCDSALKRGVMPAQSVGNKLKLDDVPPELAKLKPLEIRLICLRIPFLKLVSLPVGNQKSIHGPAVNVPSILDTLCTELPRLPSQSELIALKFKRKLSYKSHYMYDYVTPQNILDALRYLKANNPYYKDVNINDNWVTQALEDDEDVLCSLIENPPITNNTDQVNDPSPSIETSSSLEENPSIKNNTNEFQPCPSPPPLPPPVVSLSNDPVRRASVILSRVARERGFIVHDVPGDGDCLFNSIAYQLQHCSLSSDTIRNMLVSHLRENAVHYSSFVSSTVPASGNNAYNADTEAPDEVDTCIALMSDCEEQSQFRWERYLHGLSNGAWGRSYCTSRH